MHNIVIVIATYVRLHHSHPARYMYRARSNIKGRRILPWCALRLDATSDYVVAFSAPFSVYWLYFCFSPEKKKMMMMKTASYDF